MRMNTTDDIQAPSRLWSAAQHGVVRLGPLDPALFQLTDFDDFRRALHGFLGLTNAAIFISFLSPVAYASIPVGVGAESAPLSLVPVADVTQVVPGIVPCVNG